MTSTGKGYLSRSPLPLPAPLLHRENGYPR